MNPKYDEYLFSELIYKLKETNNKEIQNELYDRMNFCGFDKKMIDCFIDLDKLIINYAEIKYTKNLYDTYYWINNPVSIFKNKLKKIFMLSTSKITKNTLSFSDCISLLNEATYILITSKLNKKNITSSLKAELKLFNDITKEKFIRKEICYRFMRCYEKLDELNQTMPKEYLDMANIFINNELRILTLCKFIYPEDKQNSIRINWKPYTKEYYEYYNENDF